MPRRSFFAWLLSLLYVAKPAQSLEAAQQLFDDAIVLKPQPVTQVTQVTRMTDDALVLVDADDPSDPAVLHIHIDHATRLAWLQGQPVAVEAFCRLYQDKLWPGWQQHRLAGTVELDFADRCLLARKSWTTGTGAVSLAGKQCSRAFDQAVKSWSGPLVLTS